MDCETAEVTLDDAGQVTGANEAALALLGVSLDDLLSAPRGAFAAHPMPPDEDAAFRAQWEAAGRPGLGGESTIRRRDGTEVRIRFVLGTRPDGGYTVDFEPTGTKPDEPETRLTLGDVLTAWRHAERRLEAIDASDAEAVALRAEAKRLKEMYQQGFTARRKAESA